MAQLLKRPDLLVVDLVYFRPRQRLDAPRSIRSCSIWRRATASECGWW